MNDPRLDRLPQFDARSRNFPIRALVVGKLPRSYTWALATHLDQGQEGACVGFSVAHELAARPVIVPAVTDELARTLYHRARQLDEYPGEDYSGTSVLAGIKAASELGYYGEYRWAFGLDDLILALGYRGPALLGLNWYEEMFEPDATGFIHVGGNVAGGHAILSNAVSLRRQAVHLSNTWGPNWGLNGGCWISFSDLNRLLHEEGEACIPVKRALA